MEEDPDLTEAIKGGMGCLLILVIIAIFIYHAYIIRI
jgi:hypothetical protein